MRIAVLADNLASGGGLSVGRNILATLPLVAPRHAYLFVTPRGRGYPTDAIGDGTHVVQTHPGYSNPRGALESLVRVPRVIRRFAPDLVWALGNFPLPTPGCPQALLVQDAHLFYPESSFAGELWFERRKKRALASYLERHLDAVSLVFCQTETAARRFRDRYGYGKVAVMPNGVSRYIVREEHLDEVPGELLSHEHEFKLLALTRYYPHKNLELILDAFKLHPQLTENTVCFLTIDGSQHPGARALVRRIEEEVPGRVINLGPVPQSVLGSYFRGVDAIVQPTTLESLSATYLEAMEFGLPIITSDLDFAHEICAGAALYFDPNDPEALGRSIATLRDDSSLRNAIAQEGSSQLARQPNWPTVVTSALDAMGVSHGNT